MSLRVIPARLAHVVVVLVYFVIELIGVFSLLVMIITYMFDFNFWPQVWDIGERVKDH